MIGFIDKLLKMVTNCGDRLTRDAKCETMLARGQAFGMRLEEALGDAKDTERQALRKLLRETSVEDFWSYYVAGESAPHYHVPWRGLKMTKFPADLMIYEDLARRAKPQVILEIGTQRGTSALFFAETIKSWGGRVITVDLSDPPADAQELLHDAGVQCVRGSAVDDGVRDVVFNAIDGASTMVIDDGSHEYDDVVESFRIYNQHVPVDGYYIVEDGFTNWLLGKSTHDALGGVEYVLSHNSDFVRNHEYDHFLLFTALQGVLQRVKGA